MGRVLKAHKAVEGDETRKEQGYEEEKHAHENHA
jgi:hypothetical protein